MSAFATLVEVLVVGTVKEVDPVEHVLAGMGMNDIKQDGDTHPMCGINEFFEILGITASGSDSKKTGNLISERLGGSNQSIGSQKPQ